MHRCACKKCAKKGGWVGGGWKNGPNFFFTVCSKIFFLIPLPCLFPHLFPIEKINRHLFRFPAPSARSVPNYSPIGFCFYSQRLQWISSLKYSPICNCFYLIIQPKLPHIICCLKPSYLITPNR